jgi:hypothetical protein
MKQVLLTTAAGKRLIGIALAAHPEIKRTLANGTLVIIAGTTNGYIAEEIVNYPVPRAQGVFNNFIVRRV